LASLITGRI